MPPATLRAFQPAPDGPQWTAPKFPRRRSRSEMMCACGQFSLFKDVEAGIRKAQKSEPNSMRRQAPSLPCFEHCQQHLDLLERLDRMRDISWQPDHLPGGDLVTVTVDCDDSLPLHDMKQCVMGTGVLAQLLSGI